ncbi:MAG: hypothetical protein HFJ80_00275 [Clostridiales bacterium]|nr:hypothetical protein [Clostridiales bacterium]
MKRLTAIILCLTWMSFLIPLGVLAEGDFRAVVTAEYQAKDGELILSWETEAAAGYRLSEVTVNQEECDDFRTNTSGRNSTAVVRRTFDQEQTLSIECVFLPEKAGGEKQTAVCTLKLTYKELLGFSFSDPRPVYQASAEQFSLSYSPGNSGTQLKKIQINEKQTLSVDDNNGRVTGSIGRLSYGSHRLAYYFQTAAGAEILYPSAQTIDISGTLALRLTVGVEGGVIVASLKDENNNPVADYAVDLYISGQKLRSNKTDSDGRVIFQVAAPADRTTVRCVVTGGRQGVITYTGTEAWLQTPTSSQPTDATTTGGPVTTTTTRDDPTTTTKEEEDLTTTASSTTGTRYPVVTGAGTTARQGDMVAVDVTFDTGISGAFGLSEQAFGSQARLLMPVDFYDSLINGSQAAIVLSMRSSEKAASAPEIAAAAAGLSRFEKLRAEDAKSITMELSALFISLLDHSEADLSMPAAEMKLVLPVPAGMKDRALGIAVNTDNGLSQMIEVTPEDGMITVALNRLATITLVGFVDNGVEEKPQGGVPWMVIILIAAGVLLLGGAGVLVYIFLIRGSGDGPEDGGPDGNEPPAPGDRGDEAAEPSPPESGTFNAESRTETFPRPLQAGVTGDTMVLDMDADEKMGKASAEAAPAEDGVSLGVFAGAAPSDTGRGDGQPS